MKNEMPTNEEYVPSNPTLWGVFRTDRGDFDFVRMEIVEEVSGKNEKLYGLAIFATKEEAQKVAAQFAERYKSMDFYVRPCEVTLTDD